MTQVLTRNDSTDCGSWKDPNCYLCTEYIERVPDPETVLFHFCDKDGLGSIGLTDLINLIATHDSDADGLSDLSELSEHNTDPTLPDTDGGGVSDSDEVAAGGDPLAATDDVCLLIKPLATHEITDALNNTVLGYAWPSANAATTVAGETDALNNTVLFWLLPNDDCSPLLDLIPYTDAINGDILGYYVAP